MIRGLGKKTDEREKEMDEGREEGRGAAEIGEKQTKGCGGPSK